MQLESRIHGGIAQYQASHHTLDFSVNINPYGPSRRMEQVIRQAKYDEYPDPHCFKLRKAISQWHHCDINQIHIGNGAAEIFWSLASTRQESGGIALILEPTFSEFSVACRQRGYDLREVRSQSSHGFKHGIPSIEQALTSFKPVFTYICNPNSPTGTYIPGHQIRSLATRFSESIFVLDQAFIHMSPFSQDARQDYPENVVQIFSFTKDHSIPGIRLGYAKGSPSIIRNISHQTPTWNVSSLAQAAGLQACRESNFVSQSYLQVQSNQDYLLRVIEDLGIPWHVGHCPFVLLNVGNADRLQQNLLHHEILVRSCSSYKLPGWIRVFPRPKPDIDQLIHALKKVVES
ncbi:pyridoxal phosphate-dependent aminotransferase [Pseudobacteriovorax antillogorgiicola]|uniref:Aminotransferase n=1 Tax=Pseudobacteriovorax antillogorgiicola TaxID=1513793 RepID=A0A1Y6C194_9BACT|nr:histidinol-phosphate transaminase [Pseudobacteriovorax antillogorgiicola]TCS50687.1 threonine-phosphate decarboxylase [Pseudobacteriovorax antillogorgiicola]SMF40249.1 threonine-phosphate decarboxylase [Pseudobacteriovorax antillogorgiicola]